MTNFPEGVKIIISTPFSLNFSSDIDECEIGSHDCHVNATCNNTIGSFICVCDPGYGGTGKICSGEVYVKKDTPDIRAFSMNSVEMYFRLRCSKIFFIDHTS